MSAVSIAVGVTVTYVHGGIKGPISDGSLTHNRSFYFQQVLSADSVDIIYVLTYWRPQLLNDTFTDFFFLLL